MVPDLDARRPRAARAFHRHLPDRFHISLGPPLSARPAIAAALNLLNLCRPRVEWPVLQALLMSPYLRAAREERGPRAALDVAVRAWQAYELSPASVARNAACPPVLASLLRAWESTRRELPERQSPGAWSTTFSGLLETFGWPAAESAPNSSL